MAIDSRNKHRQVGGQGGFDHSGGQLQIQTPDRIFSFTGRLPKIQDNYYRQPSSIDILVQQRQQQYGTTSPLDSSAPFVAQLNKLQNAVSVLDAQGVSTHRTIRQPNFVMFVTPFSPQPLAVATTTTVNNGERRPNHNPKFDHEMNNFRAGNYYMQYVNANKLERKLPQLHNTNMDDKKNELRVQNYNSSYNGIKNRIHHQIGYNNAMDIIHDEQNKQRLNYNPANIENNFRNNYQNTNANNVAAEYTNNKHPQIVHTNTNDHKHIEESQNVNFNFDNTSKKKDHVHDFRNVNVDAMVEGKKKHTQIFYSTDTTIDKQNKQRQSYNPNIENNNVHRDYVNAGTVVEEKNEHSQIINTDVSDQQMYKNGQNWNLTFDGATSYSVRHNRPQHVNANDQKTQPNLNDADQRAENGFVVEQNHQEAPGERDGIEHRHRRRPSVLAVVATTDSTATIPESSDVTVKPGQQRRKVQQSKKSRRPTANDSESDDDGEQNVSVFFFYILCKIFFYG